MKSSLLMARYSMFIILLALSHPSFHLLFYASKTKLLFSKRLPVLSSWLRTALGDLANIFDGFIRCVASPGLPNNTIYPISLKSIKFSAVNLTIFLFCIRRRFCNRHKNVFSSTQARQLPTDQMVW